jgi:outer membrane protease
MKNITALSFLVIIIFSLSLSFTAHGQEEKRERNYGFSFGTQFGFIHGQSLEFVYPIYTKGELLSELRWDMKPVFYYGFQLDFNRIDLMSGPGFFASISFKAGVPADSGVMEDRDWLSIENSNLTHFSRHTNKTNEFYSLVAAIGASIPVKTYFYIKPFLSGSWTRFSFSGRDGYGIYARGEKSPDTYYPIYDNPDEDLFSGEVIRYKQDWLLLAAGVSIGTNILSPFSFDISFQISPFTYCAATDDHLDESKRITYHDYTAWGFFLEPAGRFSFSTQRIEFSLEVAWRYMGKTRGNSFLSDGSFSGNAGAGFSFIDTRLAVKLRI